MKIPVCIFIFLSSQPCVYANPINVQFQLFQSNKFVLVFKFRRKQDKESMLGLTSEIPSNPHLPALTTKEGLSSLYFLLCDIAIQCVNVCMHVFTLLCLCLYFYAYVKLGSKGRLCTLCSGSCDQEGGGSEEKSQEQSGPLLNSLSHKNQ